MIYGFKARFVAPILAGTKTGTIRAPRAGRQGHARPGMGLQFKSGSRYRPKFFADSTCMSVRPIMLHMDVDVVAYPAVEGLIASFSDYIYSRAGLDAFAMADGFADWDDLVRFWWDTHKVTTFTGFHISWAGAEVKVRP